MKLKLLIKKTIFFSYTCRRHCKCFVSIFRQTKKGEVYNISDDRPASNEEVIAYGVKLLGLKKPGILNINDIQSEMLKNFYKDSKK